MLGGTVFKLILAADKQTDYSIFLMDSGSLQKGRLDRNEMADSCFTKRRDQHSRTRPRAATLLVYLPVCLGTPLINAFLGLSQSNSGGPLRWFGPGRPG